MEEKKRRKIKEIIIRYADGHEETLSKGMLVQADERQQPVTMTIRSFAFGPNDLQMYLVGLMYFAAENLNSQTLDRLEQEADQEAAVQAVLKHATRGPAN